MSAYEAPTFGKLGESGSTAFHKRLVEDAQAGKTDKLPVFGVYGEGPEEYDAFAERYAATVRTLGGNPYLTGVAPVHIEVKPKPAGQVPEQPIIKQTLATMRAMQLGKVYSLTR